MPDEISVEPAPSGSEGTDPTPLTAAAADPPSPGEAEAPAARTAAGDAPPAGDGSTTPEIAASLESDLGAAAGPPAAGRAAGGLGAMLIWGMVVLLLAQVGWLLYSLDIFHFTQSSAPVIAASTPDLSGATPGGQGGGLPSGSGAPQALPGGAAGGPPGGLPGGAAGGPPGGFPGQPFSLSAMVSGLVALDGTANALTPAQRTRIAPLAATLLKSTRNLSADTVTLFAVLTDPQNMALVRHTPSSRPQEIDTLVGTLMAVLKKQAGPTPAPTRTVTRTPPGLMAEPLLEGMLSLERTPYALSPEQARTVLNVLTSMQQDLQKTQDAQRQIGAVLSPEQWTAVQMMAPQNESAVAALLLQVWLGQKK